MSSKQPATPSADKLKAKRLRENLSKRKSLKLSSAMKELEANCCGPLWDCDFPRQNLQATTGQDELLCCL
ncbi:hypothetical protein E2C01_032999 [Portunus trituberculatus]|uniref:Uncharacterized protein n=1 Tax=Portunus trituberculatus TaxID=210409 RepID=A0A5B7EYZ1_PORTR|nr:hypothetical protein [Portunus trituberculatus]